MPEAFRSGMSKLRETSRLIGEWDAADEWIEAGEPQNSKPKAEDDDEKFIASP